MARLADALQPTTTSFADATHRAVSVAVRIHALRHCVRVIRTNFLAQSAVGKVVRILSALQPLIITTMHVPHSSQHDQLSHYKLSGKL
jgi:hypothetical protein